MKPHSHACLVLVDAGLPSLCAAWAAGVCGGFGGPQHVGPSRGIIAMTPILRSPPSHPTTTAAARLNLIRSWASLCTLAEVIESPDAIEPPSPTKSPLHPASSHDADEPDTELAEPSRLGFEQSVLLLAACREAMARGISRVVWPIHIGDFGSLGGPDQPPPLDLIADACDRAMLAAQLASIDAGRASMGVTIELPYVDFTDRQMIEVALDLGAPIASSRWCDRDGPSPCHQCEPCARWQRALAAASPGTSLAQIVTRPSSIGHSPSSRPLRTGV